MKQKKTSDQVVSENSSPTENPPCDQGKKFPEHDRADSLINFRSPEFNVTDDLDDNIGNYREFDTLDGIMTADMLHQKERKKGKHSPAKTDNRPGHNIKAAGIRAIDAAAESDPLPLTIISSGRTLVIGTAVELLFNCGELLREQGLSCTLCLVSNTDMEMVRPKGSKQPLIQVDSIVVSGGFGGFSALTTTAEGLTQPVRLRGDKAAVFDLVLDLQTVPAFAGNRLPMGYYAPAKDKGLLDVALRELPELKGHFAKPQFTVFQGNRCLHGLSRANNCQLCLEICPVSAIRIEHEGLYIDQHRCQGCGSCSLICPADAIQMINPPAKKLAAGIRELLAASLADEVSPPVLVIHSEDISSDVLQKMTDSIGGRPVMFGIEEIARIGPEIMLAALAYGAGSVIMAIGSEIPADIIRVLETRMQICAAVLRGLDMQEDRLSLFAPAGMRHSPKKISDPAQNKTRYFAPLLPAATFSPDCDRRTLFRLAFRHLYEVSAADTPWISLPADASFGAISLDKSACTLCMVCAGVCPTGALSAGDDRPQLSFTETDCHQCGLCSEACPEGAVQLHPRMLYEKGDHAPPTLLYEDEPFTCIECGMPFAAPAMIKYLEDKLAGHWMYSNDRQIRRLRMCRICRTRDALLAKDFQR